MFSGRVLRGRLWLVPSFPGRESGRAVSRRLRGQLASAKGAIPHCKKRVAALSVFPYGPILSRADVTLPVSLVLLTLKPQRQLMGAGWRESLLAVAISL